MAEELSKEALEEERKKAAAAETSSKIAGVNDETAEDDDRTSDGDESQQGEEEIAFQLLQKSYNELKQEAEQRKLEAEAAKAEAENAKRTAESFRRQYEEGQHQVHRASTAAVDSAIAHTKKNIDVLKAELKRSAIDEDWDAFAEAQAALNENSVYLATLQSDKRAITDNARNIGVNPNAEAIIAKLSPESQEWVRKHQSDIFSSPNRQEKAQASHHMAVADGFTPDSKEYFEALDRYMGYARHDNPPPKEENSETRAPAKTELPSRQHGGMPSAPPARTDINHRPRADEVRLSKEQKDTAIRIFPDLDRDAAIKKYAENLRAIQRGNTHLRFSDDKFKGGYKGV